jgi:type II secretory pathway pseudopilin PulG
MTFRPQQPPLRTRGFTLIEQLLTVVLVLLLLGAVVYNFSTAANGARLDEGAMQMESLFRFARAHAESTGKQVRILFPEAESGDNAETLVAEAPGTTVRVMWEADPVGAPGVFLDLPEAVSYVQSISELVSIQQVQPGGQSAEATAEAATPEVEASETSAVETSRSPFSVVNFYPDGTGDSVEIVLTSRDETDVRRVTVRLAGLTGTIRRQAVADPTEPEPPAPATEAAAEGVK